MIKVILALLLLAYPFLVYWGIQVVSPSVIGLFLLTIVLLRFWHFKKHLKKFPALPVVTIACSVLLTWGSFNNSEFALKLYPVVVNISFFAVFAYSLIKPPSVITLVASLKEELNDKAIAYTIKVTKVWCFFFIINGSIASYTVFAQDKSYWLIYNGFISYLLMGMLVAGEWLIRRRQRKINEQIHISK